MSASRESLATTFFFLWADYEYQGVLQQRGQKELLPTSDGWIYPRWQPSVPWDVYAIGFDAPELSVDEELQPPLGMTLNAERLAAALAEHTKLKTRREWIDVAVAHGIPMGFLQSPDEVLRCPQLEARSFFDRMRGPDGGEVRFPGRPYTRRWTPGVFHAFRAPARDGGQCPRRLALERTGAVGFSGRPPRPGGRTASRAACAGQRNRPSGERSRRGCWPTSGRRSSASRTTGRRTGHGTR